MRKSLLLLLAICFTYVIQAQISYSVNITVPGTLKAQLIAAGNLTTISNLTVTGSLDARDFKTMWDEMPKITDVDLSGVTIVAYTGTEGCGGTTSIIYPANTIPQYLNSRQGSFALKSVILPTNITAIGNNAFFACILLTSINIPSSVTSIGVYAFGSCEKLSLVTIPSSVTRIGANAFAYLDILESISIPASVTTISSDAFTGSSCNVVIDASNPNYSSSDGLFLNKAQTVLYFCPKAKTGDYTLPATVQTIVTYAFQDCLFSTLHIPASVTSIQTDAFRQFGGDFDVATTNANYSSIDGVLFNKDKTSLLRCPKNKTGTYTIPSTVLTLARSSFESCSLENVVVPSGLTTFGFGCFYESTKLKTINIPSTVTTIEEHIFIRAGSLSSIYIGRNTPIVFNLSSTVFYDVDVNTCTLYVPTGAKTAYETAVLWRNFTHIIEGNGFWITPTAANIAKTNGSNTSLSIRSNTTWSISSDVAWLSLSSVSGSGNETIVLTAEANPTNTTRVATITVSSPGLTSQTLIITQEAYPTLSVSATTASVAKTANSTATVNVTSNTDWSASDDAAWLTLSTASGMGNETLTFTAQANPTITTRIATVTLSATGVASKTITVTQAVGDPTLSVSATTASVAKAANSTASVNVVSNTTWSAADDATWLTLSTTSGVGNATLTFTAQVNPTITTRIATVTLSATGVASKTITVTQAVGDPTLSVSATTASVAKAANSTASVSVISNTDWSTADDAEWLTLSISSGTGYASLTLTAQANPTITTRIATVTISATGVASKTITVTQAVGDPTLSVSATTATVAKAANSTASVNVMSNTDWSAADDAAWLTLSAEYETGNATLTLTAEANPNITTRFATITISATGVASKTITVTQAVGDPTLSVSATTASVNNLANSSASVNVISNTTWNAADDDAWLTLSTSSGTGNATLTFTAQVNPIITTRIATVTISATGVASKTITVTQAVGDPILLVSVSEIFLPSQSGSNNLVTVTSNTTWQAYSNQDWLTVSPFTLTGNGTLSITATTNNGLTARSATITITTQDFTSKTITVNQAANTTAIEPNDEMFIILYPNPTTDGFIVKAGDKPTLLTMIDLRGRKVLSKFVANNEYVDISALNAGVYIVFINGKNIKLVKNK